MRPIRRPAARRTPATDATARTPVTDATARTLATENGQVGPRSRRRRPVRLLSTVTAAVLALALAAGCSGSDGGGGDDDKDQRGQGRSPGTLRVLASSELADVWPVLEEAERATGVKVEPTWTGTLDGAQQVASGKADGKYDAVWLASNDYLRLLTGESKKLRTQTPIVSSPVALGVRSAAVQRLGWNPEKVTWAQVHQAVTDGKLNYGMTDPVRSNSGYSALIALTSALSGAQSALTEDDVKKASPKLREFFAGQRLTSGSSGWLAQAFARRASQEPQVDALINYESVLLSLKRGKLTNGTGTPGADGAQQGDAVAGISDLTIIRPTDGVITANYPLSLLSSAAPSARAADTPRSPPQRAPPAPPARPAPPRPRPGGAARHPPP
ncbi:substrate-binding domain-containing protein, partial [Streptomyces sp. HSW2009]|uniref:substrate-binding domain-containing protein n=1 Tax=Streptomyces sp. HSW2009 TaxID=3142890 RepID=UPI0032ED6B31